MWLLPVIPRVASLALRMYYRITTAGGTVPARGPVLLVANHPNSLLDPAMVSMAAGRPVRFLAKAPLFGNPFVGWLVQATGSIPVYRAQDNPAVMGRNDEMFRAVQQALAGGSAVGIFPEGLSHSEPSIAPLKTGAARIALGAYPLLSRAFPIVPVGLVLRARERFRSEALIVVGGEVEWSDLAPRGVGDADAVRELTRRIDAALRTVTLNLERWEDAPLVEWVEAIYGAELAPAADPVHRLDRLRTTTEILSRVRHEDAERWRPLARDVTHHARLLRQLGLTPAGLHADVSARAAVRWALVRLPLLGLPVVLLTLLGLLVYWPPYRLTGVLGGIGGPHPDGRSTHKVLAAIPLFIVWTGLLAAAVAAAAGARAAVAALIALPALGLFALAVAERWRDMWADARRFFLLRRQDALIAEIRTRQRDLALRLHEVRDAFLPRAPRPQTMPPGAAHGAAYGAARPVE